MMVRPASFGWNPQTAASNRFQIEAPEMGDLQPRALVEFDALAGALVAAGIEVHAFDDRPEPRCPDALFPNNWVSLHADGTVVIYPMLAPNRRLERRRELLSELERAGGLRIRRTLDLSRHELEGRFLEGTGSIVFDHVTRVAYLCRSPRSDVRVLRELCDEIGYQPCTFDAAGSDGTPVYHTNVMLSIGSRYVLVTDEALAARDRDALLERLAVTGRRAVMIDLGQMSAFAGNLLELRSRSGRSVLAISERGLSSLSPQQRTSLAECVDEIVAVPVRTIEEAGGGSVRCMLAEVFLPRS
jgi:hypothetical protein